MESRNRSTNDPIEFTELRHPVRTVLSPLNDQPHDFETHRGYSLALEIHHYRWFFCIEMPIISHDYSMIISLLYHYYLLIVIPLDRTWYLITSYFCHFPHLERGASGTHGSVERGSRLGDGWTWRTCGYISQPRSGGKLSDSRRILLCSGAKGWKLLDSARSWCPIVILYIYIL